MILVIGDFLVDRYSFVDTSRKSPEHDGQIYNIVRDYEKPGGAGFVVNYMECQNIPCESINLGINQICKHRILCKDTYKILARIDYDGINIHTRKVAKRSDIEDKLLSIDPKSISAVICSDYNKGMFVNREVSDLILDWARQHKIVTFVDTKRPLEQWAGYDFIKMNADEAEAQNFSREKTVHYNTTVIITEGKKGATICHGGDWFFVENYNKEQAIDVVGAGDVFGVEFVKNYIKNRSRISSLQYAVDKASEYVRQPLEAKISKLGLLD